MEKSKMKEFSVYTADFCRFFQSKEVFQQLLRIHISKKVSSVENANSQYLDRIPPVGGCGGEWRLKREVDSVLTRQFKSLRRGPSETLVLSGNQF